MISQEQREELETKIADLEKQTSAEVVCALMRESGRYDRAESIVGLLTGIVAISGYFFFVKPFFHSGWTESATELAWIATVLVIGFVAGNYLAAYCKPLRRMFTSDEEMRIETDRAASGMFLTASIGETHSRCGLLIFISMYEHRIVILPDVKTREALTDKLIQDACAAAATQVKEHGAFEGFVAVFDQISEELIQKMPADRELSRDEISDHLIVS